MKARIKDMQSVTDLTAEFLGINKPIRIKVKDISGGRANTRTRCISVPKWAMNNEHYAIYYAVHEVCHYRVSGHGIAFKLIEKNALSQWNIEIEYSRAYPKSLSCNGQKVYDKKRDKLY